MQRCDPHILAYGDSLTAGATSFVGGGRKYPQWPYAPALQRWLRNLKVNATIDHKGLPGKSSEALRQGMRATDGLVSLLHNAQRAGNPYNLVLLWVGANDALQAMAGVPGRVGPRIERLEDNVRALHAAARCLVLQPLQHTSATCQGRQARGKPLATAVWPCLTYM